MACKIPNGWANEGNVKHEFEVAIYFPPGADYTSIDYRSHPTDAPFSSRLTVYCLHAIRGLVNTSHSLHGKGLAASLRTTRDIHEMFLDDPFYRPRPVAGSVPRQRVVLKAAIEDGRSPFLNLKIKGFGFFGEGPTVGCVQSVGVHLCYLAELASGQSRLHDQLLCASELCAAAAIRGDLGLSNQASNAASIAAEALSA